MVPDTRISPTRNPCLFHLYRICKRNTGRIYMKLFEVFILSTNSFGKPQNSVFLQSNTRTKNFDCLYILNLHSNFFDFLSLRVKATIAQESISLRLTFYPSLCLQIVTFGPLGKENKSLPFSPLLVLCTHNTRINHR